MLSFLLFMAIAAAAPAHEPPEASLARGKEALAAKNVSLAETAFQDCIAASGAGTIVWSDCHWELGWVFWLRGDWAGVVEQWQASAKVTPDREGLERYLKQARDNLGLAGLLAKGREGAVQTYRSEVPDGTTVRLRAVGDMMIGTDFPAGVLNPEVNQTFSDVRDWLSDADLTFGNLEGPLCDSGKTNKCKPGAPAGSCYAFRSPTAYRAIFQSAGFDVVSTANNHAGDFGEVCREATESALDDVGIAHTGRPGDIASLEVNGLKVAVVGFHTSRNSHYVNDHETAQQLVRALDTEHDLVLVSFHGGAEGSKALHVPLGRETFYGENRGDLRAFTHAVIEAGADLVWGHGPHVLRAMEVYQGRLIAYSLGNFATYGRFNVRGQQGLGVVLETVLDSDGKFISGRILPTRQAGEGVPKRDDKGEAIDVVRLLSEEDFPKTGVLVAQDGSIRAR